MPMFKLVFSEERSRVRRILVDIIADNLDRAAEAAVEAYESGKFEASLEADKAEETVECRNEVGYHNLKNEYIVLHSWE